MRALCTKYEDEPHRASRPFDKDRCGFVIGEGSGVLVLEDYDFAKARGAEIICEVAGFGMSCDAYHITAPDFKGSSLAVKQALKVAQLSPESIDYVNAHATSTEVGDIAETESIKLVFGNHASKLNISSTKSMTGHLLGGAGGVEAIYTIMALKTGIIPPTINLENPDSRCDLNYTPNVAIERTVNAAISNSFGFGGTNASLVFKKLS
jgi:3-oxoacyl-[acyl-carrier-protein] synthase II